MRKLTLMSVFLLVSSFCFLCASMGCAVNAEPLSTNSSVTNSSSAKKMPSARIVIHFVKEITAEQRSELEKILNANGVEDLHLAGSSHEKRWIVMLPSSFDGGQMNVLCLRLSELSYVLAAEPDAMMIH